MFFPFSLKTPTDWLDIVPNFLQTLSDDSEYLNKIDFHQYLAAKLQSFFSQAPGEFLVAINSILTQATEAGKYVLIETLLQAEIIWSVLAQDLNLQPTLTELALSTDSLYSRSAAQLSSRLEEIQSTPDRLYKATIEPSIERIDFGSTPADDTLDLVMKETVEKRKKTAPPRPTLVPPSAPPGAPPPGPPAGESPVPKLPSPAPADAPPSQPPTRGPPPPPLEILKTEMAADLRDVFIKIKDEAEDEEFEEAPPELKAEDAELEEAVMLPEEKPMEPSAISPERKQPRRIHTHVHYFARMNPRKTYPFIVTLSSLAQKIAREKTYFLSGEKEKETRGEFELREEKLLMVEPLLSGCLVQPTFQFIDPDPLNFPMKLKFFVTPLVDPGFRATPLQGTLFVKNEEGTILYEMPLPELSVTSGRISQIAAAIGIIAGGAMPAFDTIYGTELQASLVTQLTQYLGSLVQSVDMWLVVQGAELLIFTALVGGGILWWLTRGRAKRAPDRTMTLQLPQ
jgi:hypothetical protein